MSAARILAAAGLALLVILSAPAASAQQPQTWDARLKDCNNAMCIVEVLLGGMAQIVSAAFLGLGSIAYTLTAGFANAVLAPAFGIFTSFFQGLGSSLGAVAGALFNGVGEAFATAYAHLENSLFIFGPFAPIVATAVVGVIVFGAIWAFSAAFDKGNDPLPGPLERLVDADDEDDEDDDE